MKWLWQWFRLKVLRRRPAPVVIHEEPVRPPVPVRGNRMGIPCAVLADGVWTCTTCGQTSTRRGWGTGHVAVCEGQG